MYKILWINIINDQKRIIGMAPGGGQDGVFTPLEFKYNVENVN